MNEAYERLGTNIRVEMIKNNLSTKKLAEELEIDPTYLSSMLTGKKRFSLPILKKIKKILPNAEIDLNVFLN